MRGGEQSTKEQAGQRYVPKWTVQEDIWKVTGGENCLERSEKLVKILRKRGIIFIISVPQGVIQPLLQTSTVVSDRM